SIPAVRGLIDVETGEVPLKWNHRDCRVRGVREFERVGNLGADPDLVRKICSADVFRVDSEIHARALDRELLDRVRRWVLRGIEVVDCPGLDEVDVPAIKV